MADQNTNTLAVVSLVFGAVSWIMLPLVAAVVAVVTGHMARKQIRESGEDGDQMAVIGLVLGYANIGIGVIVLGVIVLGALGALFYTTTSGAPPPVVP